MRLPWNRTEFQKERTPWHFLLPHCPHLPSCVCVTTYNQFDSTLPLVILCRPVNHHNPAIAVTSHRTVSVTHTYKGPPATTVTTICYTQYLTNPYLRNQRLLVTTINAGDLCAPKAPCPWIPRHCIQTGYTEEPKEEQIPKNFIFHLVTVLPIEGRWEAEIYRKQYKNEEKYSIVFNDWLSIISCQQTRHINPYPTAFPYGNGMVLHFYQQQESSTTKTVHKVINKGLKTYV